MPNLLTQETLAGLTTTLQATMPDAEVTDAVAEQALESAIRDLERHSPRQAVYEATVTEHKVTSQLLYTFNGAATPKPALIYIKYLPYGEDVDVNTAWDYFKPIRPFTEHLWQTAGKYLTRGTDYLINYATGAIYIPATSTVSTTTGAKLYASYETDISIIDLAPLYKLSGLGSYGRINPIRVTAVEYPVGTGSHLQFDAWGELLFVHWPAVKGGSSLKQHISIHYETDEYIPDASSDTFPSQDASRLATTFLTKLDSYFGEELNTDERLQAMVSSVEDICRHTPLQLIRDYDIATDPDFDSTDPRRIDISDINLLSGQYGAESNGVYAHKRNCFIRVTKVEYPVGHQILFHTWDDYLYVNQHMHPGQVLRVYWEACYLLDYMVEQLYALYRSSEWWLDLRRKNLNRRGDGRYLAGINDTLSRIYMQRAPDPNAPTIPIWVPPWYTDGELVNFGSFIPLDASNSPPLATFHPLNYGKTETYCDSKIDSDGVIHGVVWVITDATYPGDGSGTIWSDIIYFTFDTITETFGVTELVDRVRTYGRDFDFTNPAHTVHAVQDQDRAPNILLDSSNRPYIIYVDNNITDGTGIGESYVRVATRSGGVWSSETAMTAPTWWDSFIDNQGLTCWFWFGGYGRGDVSAAIDSNDDIHITALASAVLYAGFNPTDQPVVGLGFYPDNIYHRIHYRVRLADGSYETQYEKKCYGAESIDYWNLILGKTTVIDGVVQNIHAQLIDEPTWPISYERIIHHTITRSGVFSHQVLIPPESVYPSSVGFSYDVVGSVIHAVSSYSVTIGAEVWILRYYATVSGGVWSDWVEILRGQALSGGRRLIPERLAVNVNSASQLDFVSTYFRPDYSIYYTGNKLSIINWEPFDIP